MIAERRRTAPLLFVALLVSGLAAEAAAQAPAGRPIRPDPALIARIQAIRTAVKRQDSATLMKYLAPNITVEVNLSGDSKTETLTADAMAKDVAKFRDPKEAKLAALIFSAEEVATAVRYVMQLPGNDVLARMRTKFIFPEIFKAPSMDWCVDLIFRKAGREYLLKGLAYPPKDFDEDVWQKLEQFAKRNPNAQPAAKLAEFNRLFGGYIKRVPRIVKAPVGVPAYRVPTYRVIKNPPPKMLPDREVTPAVRQYRKDITQAVTQNYPQMAGQLTLEVFLSFNRVRFYVSVFQIRHAVMFGTVEFRFTIRIVFTRSDRGRLNDWIVPVIDPVKPPPPPPPWRRGPMPVPPPRRQTTCMVLTNLAKLRQKHAADFDRIHALLKSFGPIIDISRAGIRPDSFQAVDGLVESRFDRNKNDCLFIFGNHDVVPFGAYRNLAYKDGVDRDKDVLSDDPYADFNHDSNNDYDIMVTRLPDDPGILQSKSSVLNRPASSSPAPAYKNFVVYGNKVWLPAVQHYARLGNPSRPTYRLSAPWSRPKFSGDFFRGANVMIDLHGSDRDGTAYWGNVAQKTTLPAMGIEHASAPGAVIFCGCCYGASIAGKDSRNHIGLRFLQNGARAYIGGTRIIYGGTRTTSILGRWGTYFQKRVQEGIEPARAFMLAKRDFAKYYNGLRNPDEKPFEHKMLHQMVYYGLPPVGVKRPQPPGPTMTVLRYSDGRRYEGEVLNKKPHGAGTMTWPAGRDTVKYVGEFRNGRRHGRGKYYWSNGERYEGVYADGKKNGQGVYYFKSGSKYDGLWKAGKRDGLGTYHYKSGTRFVGQWRSDKKHGRGVMHYTDGGRYEGVWKDGLATGGWRIKKDGTRSYRRQDKDGKWIEAIPPMPGKGK